jgi:hypothetical protein
MDSQIKSSPADNAPAMLTDIPTKEVLLSMLLRDTYQVTFNKLDGDERIMTCTLKPEFLPPRDIITEEDTSKETNPVDAKNITVWDTTANAWRSFHYARVKKVASLSCL